MLQSHGQMIDYFQCATSANFEQTLDFLTRHNWKLTNAVQEYRANDAAAERNLSNHFDQPLSTPDITNENDQYYAALLQAFINESNGDCTTAEKKMATIIVMGECKRIALVAHNNKKAELIECLKQHRGVLVQHKLYGTGTTGSLVEKELKVPVTKFESGPFGGDQQIGAKITKRELDILIFFIDPLDSHPHTADVQALIRLAQVYGIVCATTPATVDFILTSNKMSESHVRQIQLAQTTTTK